ncbi:hypothetical protein M0R89_03880 [Halorussus limi]|uniref:EVE domain-containing protein n=1 Tax=Halorussus limi TaxID=2938695 RepID=A0A8U0HVR9_9EURY|nr:hypothetical protein [Halorussus limi]UPV75215.1 hypothetical protein M0R89_03880 [Halorussus limi]
MSTFLIQVSGHSIQEKADRRYIAGAKGPRFCDEPLKHGEYFNASPFWKREGYGRREAWQSILPGDEVLVYCTGSVDEHGACLSHLLTVESVILSESDGARLEFSSIQELIPKIPYSDIQEEIEKGSFSEQMNYCGQEGFNIAQITASDIDRVRNLVDSMESQEGSSNSRPDDSLETIAEDHFGG